ncbi:protein of unknown function [Xenorhabdus doucetiae]|uniref:Uncharacterized protein n=1 Tax=Xenorhabdus doucetiae TaxID=351671 RepID=A0A068QQ37_9GAMM|nr:protein of unknown function [Xenorhabdus doucetiae]CDG15956.1 protein of unknown function [Xenorhabdus doucetiae]
MTTPKIKTEFLAPNHVISKPHSDDPKGILIWDINNTKASILER